MTALSQHQHLLDPVVLNHPQRQFALKVMDLLKTGQFDALQALLAPSWAAFESGALSDLGLSRTWSHLRLQRTDLIEPAQAWVQAYPNSFAALLFAAQLHCSVAWQARGTATSNNTSEKQFAVMQQHFDAAFPYLHRALAAAARPTLAIAVGIAMARAGSDDPEHDYIARAQPHLPHSPVLYGCLMWALNPQWGGSVAEVDALFRAAQQWSASWPDEERKRVHATHRSELANIEACNGDSDRAIALLNGILHDAPDFDVAHSQLARQYNYKDQMQRAADHLLRAVRIMPEADRFDRLGDYYEELGQQDVAMAYFEEAMLWGSGSAAGSVANLLSDQLTSARADQRPAIEEQLGRVAPYGMQQFSPRTMFVMGSIEFFQRGDEAAKVRAYDWWREAARWGHSGAMFNLGIAHFDGEDGQTLNKAMAIQYLSRSASLGHLSSHERLGKALLTGDGIAQDLESAAYHLEIAADGENVYAMRDWICCLWFGRGTPQDRDTAKQLLQRLKALSPEMYESARERIGLGASIKNWVGKLFA
ncbi:MAG: hypothetical protein ACK4OE_13640 [Acidovorax sp.]|uniref:SEL1-like repeat protein n=1 Tax=Acidovorax sp. TaxID=1872122 RepID=UPI00391AA80C